jgi:hypothetical protein
MDGAALAGAERRARERGQPAARGVRRCTGLRQIDLHDLVAGALAGVLDVHRDGGVLSRLELRGNDEVRVAERRVREAVAEGVERRLLDVAVGAAAHGVVLEGRQVLLRAVDGDGQPAAGADVAEEDLGDRRAALLARIPGVQDRGDVGRRPRDGDRAAGRQHEHDGLAGRDGRLEEALLCRRQAQARAIAARVLGGLALLALVTRREPEDRDDRVAALHDRLRLGELGARGAAARERRASRIGDLDARLARPRADALEQRHGARRLAVVVAEQHLAIVRRRPRRRRGGARPARAAARRRGSRAGRSIREPRRRASSRCSGASTADAGVAAHLTDSGGSNMPSRNRAANKARHGVVDGRIRDPAVRPAPRPAPGIRPTAHVRAGVQSERGRLLVAPGHVVTRGQIADGAAVADDVALEPPRVAQRLLQERRAGRTGLAVRPVVSGHDGRDAPLAHEGLELRQVRVGQVVRRDARVEAVAQRLGTAVRREVLGRRDGLQMMLVLALHAAHERHAPCAP